MFENALVKPAREGGDRLCILSGYATSAMAMNYFHRMADAKLDLKVDLIVGMSPRDGIPLNDHGGFIDLSERIFPDKFSCKYIHSGPAVHSKVYLWMKGEVPFRAFVGSANFTQTAFSSRQREILSESDAKSCFEYFTDVESSSVVCQYNGIEDLVRIYRPRHRLVEEVATEDWSGEQLEGLEQCKLSLKDRSGHVPKHSGLNWGQRDGREPNQAYLSVPVSVQRAGFFPERGDYFTVLTDDNKTMICARRQDSGKAIHSTENNSILGAYFRSRLGLSSGEYVDNKHLNKYGRDTVSFYKLDDETYFMDFSV